MRNGLSAMRNYFLLNSLIRQENKNWWEVNRNVAFSDSVKLCVGKGC